MKIKSAIMANTLFLLFLGAIHYCHNTFFPVNVVFYAAIGDVFLATMVAGMALFFFTFFQPLGNLEKSQLILIWLLAGYGLAISIPTVIDRSLSFYILEKLQQRGGGIRQESFEDIFSREYMKEHRLVDVRLTEQLESGTIVIENGCVKLTKKGNEIASFGRFYRQNFLPKNRLLMGEYTDDLTDPFRNSGRVPAYLCQ